MINFFYSIFLIFSKLVEFYVAECGMSFVSGLLVCCSGSKLLQKLLSLESGFAATSAAQWHTNEARRKAQPAECNIVIFDTEAERLLQYDVNGTRQHSQPFMGFLYHTKLHHTCWRTPRDRIRKQL